MQRILALTALLVGFGGCYGAPPEIPPAQGVVVVQDGLELSVTHSEAVANGTYVLIVEAQVVNNGTQSFWVGFDSCGVPGWGLEVSRSGESVASGEGLSHVRFDTCYLSHEVLVLSPGEVWSGDAMWLARPSPCPSRGGQVPAQQSDCRAVPCGWAFTVELIVNDAGNEVWLRDARALVSPQIPIQGPCLAPGSGTSSPP